MNTATITWVTYNNYGTLLQAYALQKYIESLGHHNEIISDDIILKEFGKKRVGSEKPLQVKPRPEGIYDRLKRVLSNPQQLGRIITSRIDRRAYEYPYFGAQDRCEAFKKNELQIRYGVSSEKLPELNRDYDAFVCGSDQIWSVFLKIFHPYYYLDFVEKGKISYAPSLGTDRIPEEIKAKLPELLSCFSAISVRERVSAEQLSALCGKEVEWVCDPTLLFERSFWGRFPDQSPVLKPGYLLCYFLENNSWYFELAKSFAKKLNLKIKLISNKWEFLRNENIIRDAVGPKEFVSLFQNADYVLTDSYHGSIYSLIFEKDFYYIKRFTDDDPNSQNIRIESLFSRLDIMDRVLSKGDPIPRELRILDFTEIQARLSEFREHSQNYLSRSLCRLQERPTADERGK